MDIKNNDDGNSGEFFIEEGGEKAGMLTYSWKGKDRIIIEHTEVDDILKGKGAGKQLIRKAVDFAREKNIKIVPVCSFAKSVLDKTLEYRDVL
jgi:uncharacterized protein